MLKMSQWVERTPSGDRAWREEALSPVDRKVLTCLKEGLGLQQLHKDLGEPDLATLERVVGALVRRGWVALYDARPALSAPSPARVEERLSPLEALKRRREQQGASEAPPAAPSEEAKDVAEAAGGAASLHPEQQIPGTPSLASLVNAPTGLPEQSVSPSEGPLGKATTPAGLAPVPRPLPAPQKRPPEAFNENWRGGLSDEVAVSRLTMAFSETTEEELLDTTSQQPEASAEEMVRTLEEAFEEADLSRPVEVLADEAPLPEEIDTELVAKLEAAIIDASRRHYVVDEDSPQAQEPTPIYPLEQLSELMGVSPQPPIEEEEDGEAPPVLTRQRSARTEEILRHLESSSPGRVSARQHALQKQQRQEMEAMKRAAVEAEYAAQREREKQQAKGSVMDIAEQMRLKRLARESKDTDKKK